MKVIPTSTVVIFLSHKSNNHMYYALCHFSNFSKFIQCLKVWNKSWKNSTVLYLIQHMLLWGLQIKLLNCQPMDSLNLSLQTLASWLSANSYFNVCKLFTPDRDTSMVIDVNIMSYFPWNYQPIHTPMSANSSHQTGTSTEWTVYNPPPSQKHIRHLTTNVIPSIEYNAFSLIYSLNNKIRTVTSPNS